MKLKRLFQIKLFSNKSFKQVLTVIMLICVLPLQTQVVINEVMTRNISTFKDDDGHYNNFIELLNTGSSSVNLNGYRLTNNINQPDKWIFSNKTLKAGEYLKVWASGKNRGNSPAPARTLIPFEDTWKYLDDGSDQGSAWRGVDYNDTSWKEGKAMLGYPATMSGQPSVTTIVSYGQNSADVHRCTYFRKTINIEDKSSLGNITLWAKIDDGAVVYINGTEVARGNMPTGEIDYLTLASTNVSTGGVFHLTQTISSDVFVNGDNVIAVQVHQYWAGSSDLRFDLELKTAGSDAHTNFTISDGDQVSLITADGSQTNTTPIITTLNAISLGRFPNGSQNWKYLLSPTPGAANIEPALDVLPTIKTSISNPYSNVNWKTVNHFKTNIHTHTTNSDGSVLAHTVVDSYCNAGYKILSITDHNKITYPWTNFSSIITNFENRDPQALGMLDVKGNELSGAHHVGSYVDVVSGNGADLHAAFTTMTDIGGIGSMNHPGRYWEISTNYAPSDQYSIEWYLNFYEKYPVIVGMEVYNGTSRYPNDRILWDELLTRTMPSRPIWGQSSDDMHSASAMFKAYDYRLMQELTNELFKTSMKQGTSYFVIEPAGNGTPQVATLDSISVNQTNKTITIHAKNYTSIEWISGVKGTGAERTSKVIASGATFSYDPMVFPYVRAEIINQKGVVFTQPFGFNEYASNTPILEQNDKFKVYPNPFSNVLTIENFNSDTTVDFNIINSVGQIVMSGKMNDKISVSTDNFAPGIYIVNIRNGKSQLFNKIIK